MCGSEIPKKEPWLNTCDINLGIFIKFVFSSLKKSYTKHFYVKSKDVGYIKLPKNRIITLDIFDIFNIFNNRTHEIKSNSYAIYFDNTSKQNLYKTIFNDINKK